MRAQTTKLYNWAIQKAESSKAPLWIGLLFFLEIVLFIPLDAILMFFCLRNRKKTPLYVLLATLASACSGLFGYLLGHFLWDLLGPYIVPHFISASAFNHLSHQFQTYESWAVFFGGFLPFPLKALSISAGVFHLGITPFLLWFLAARFLRFSLIGAAILFFGEPLKQFVDRHFHRIFLVVGAKVAAAFALFWVLAK